MPSWKIHRKWARRLGIPDNISKEVDELIDFPEEWFKKKYPKEHEKVFSGQKMWALSTILGEKEPCVRFFVLSLCSGRFGHDMGRKRKWQRDFQLECVYKHYGLDGVKAVVLHHALDYIEKVSFFEKEKVLQKLKEKLGYSWVLNEIEEIYKYEGDLDKVRKVLFDKYGKMEGSHHILNKSCLFDIAIFEVLLFIQVHYDEIFKDISSY